MDGPHVYVRAWALGCFHSFISTQTFRRALTASVDSCTQSLAEGAGKRCSEYGVQPVPIVMQKKTPRLGRVSLSVGLQTQPLRAAFPE